MRNQTILNRCRLSGLLLLWTLSLSLLGATVHELCSTFDCAALQKIGRSSQSTLLKLNVLPGGVIVKLEMPVAVPKEQICCARWSWSGLALDYANARPPPALVTKELAQINTN